MNEIEDDFVLNDDLGLIDIIDWFFAKEFREIKLL